MKIKLTFEAFDLLESQISKKLTKKIIRKNLSFLKRFFGSEILVEAPSGFQNLTPQIINIINVAQKADVTINKIESFHDEPFLFNYFGKHSNKTYGGGADFFSKESALWKTLAETLERTLWKKSDCFYRKKIATAPYSKFKNKAIILENIAGFSKKQRAINETISFDESTSFGWIKVMELTSKKKIFCPIQLFSSHYFNNSVKDPSGIKGREPMLQWPITTGLATGKSLNEAITKGILEIIERDAFMVTFLKKVAPCKINLNHIANQSENIKKILSKFKRHQLEVALVKLPTDFTVFITLAIIIDKTGKGPALTVGASADFNIEKSILDSLAECMSVRIASRRRNIKKHPKSNIMDREGRIFFWSQLINLDKLDFLLKGPEIYIDLRKKKFFEDNQKYYYQKKLENLIKETRNNRYQAYSAELTTSSIKKLGFRVVKVFMPQMQPMSLIEEIPYLGEERLENLSKKLKLKTTIGLNSYPHPFP